VLERLAKKDLNISPEQWVRGPKDIEFLRYTLTPQRMRMAQNKTNAIKGEETPK
jgi:hypothetical protein